jgi:hypothetical protein
MKKFKVTFEDEIRYVSEIVIEGRDKESAKRKFNDMSEEEFENLDCKDLEVELISTKVKKIEGIEG